MQFLKWKTPISFTHSLGNFKLTTNDIQGAQGHVREAVEAFFVAQLTLQALDQHGTLLLEDVYEIVEDFEVERRRKDLPPGVPLFALAGEQARSEPGFQELVVVTLFDVPRTAENGLELNKMYTVSC